ncbi:hypothetical protein [Pelomonas cellulosilytica]|uniref:Type II secretion system (T2SS), protein M subtype b n=1 Tax=Pelomonas cellulosilytica TaxID=2906762 RepID=A0ABS8XZ57_9BURK|nr:hypothetical protein [Pelomonas sp. P8]MCE4556955.1 hypothetical protein [Pelomonas sp. P8]
MRRWWFAARRAGWPALLALALTLAAVAGAVWLPAQQSRLDAERQSLAQRRAALAGRPALASNGDAFTASLPPDNERQARTAALLALATELGLPLPRSEFRYQADREAGIAQYRIAMQLNGRYATLRDFIAEGLKRDPGLALDGVRLRRDAGRPGEVKAELAWVLHMQVAR